MGFGGFLKQSTAVDVLIGPFVDSTDGDTEETGLTVAQADVRLSKNGQTGAQKNDATSAAHDADGFYNCELDATDTNTVGQLTLYVHVAGALAVRHDYHVVEENVYDAWFAASGAAGTDLAAILVDTGTTLPATLTTIDTVVDNIETDTQDLQTQVGTAGAGLSAVPWNSSWDTEVQSEVDDALKALNLDHLIVTSGTAQAGASSSITLAAGESAVDNYFNRAIVTIIGGTGVGQSRIINAYTGSSKLAAVHVNWRTAPDATSVYIIVPSYELTDDDIADQVWDEDNSSHQSPGTTGEALDNADDATADISNRIPAALVGGRIDATIDATGFEDAAVDKVWDEAQADHVTAGSFGEVATEVAAILADTNELQTDDVPGLIAALNDLAAADINAEVVDALATDTYAEPSQGTPAATVSLADKINYLYKNWRNRKTQDATTWELYNDNATTVDHKSTVSDDGTDAEKGEIVSGP